MASPIRCSIKSSSSPEVAKVIGKKRIGFETVIMNRSAGVDSHGVAGEDQELDGSEDAEEEEGFFYFHGTKVGKKFLLSVFQHVVFKR